MCRPPLLAQKGSSPSLNEDFALCLFESKMGTSLKKKKWMAILKHQCEYMHHIACIASKLALNGIYNLRYTVFERISLTEKKLFLKKNSQIHLVLTGVTSNKNKQKNPNQLFFQLLPFPSYLSTNTCAWEVWNQISGFCTPLLFEIIYPLMSSNCRHTNEDAAASVSRIMSGFSSFSF